jgi:hypothetical protein
MNLDSEVFEQVLTELAERADAHPTLDRLQAVRARARRNARRRVGALASGLAILIAVTAGVGSFGGLPLLRGQSQSPAEPVPTGTYLSVRLVRDEAKEATLTPRFSGGRVVVVTVILHARVPQWSGYQAGADVTDNLSEMLLTADGGNMTVTVRPTQAGFRCDPGAPLVDIDTSFPVSLQYRPGVVTPMLGRHHLRFTAGACVPVGLVQQKLTVVVR